MRILYLSYWSVDEGLSEATVIPHLEILSSFSIVDSIIFCSVERARSFSKQINIAKVSHVPLMSKPAGNVFLTKTRDFTLFPKTIAALCASNKVDLIFCRSSMAGAVGYLVHRKTGIPYVVESFEPHASYMAESKVWSVLDPRFILQKYFEQRQKRTAAFLLPVTFNYQQQLVDEGVPENKIIVVPCGVSFEKFAFDQDLRRKVRDACKIEQDVVTGIYVGKFGGIYYTHEAFAIFKEAFSFFKNFRLILLTDSSPAYIGQLCEQAGIAMNSVFVRYVPHSEVPGYLSAADFAFSLRKETPSRKFFSPIKTGEYWASGLPVVTEYNTGDDSAIVEHEGGGVLLPPSNYASAFAGLQKLLDHGRAHNAKEISMLAKRHRSFLTSEEAYGIVLAKYPG